MLEFKLQMYYQIYKDKPIISVTKFKANFIKKEGNFELLNELVNMIQKYQYKKYGNLLAEGKMVQFKVATGYYNHNYNCRIRSRFGTLSERKKRKKDWSDKYERDRQRNDKNT